MPLRQPAMPAHDAGAQAPSMTASGPRAAMTTLDWRTDDLQRALQGMLPGLDVTAVAECPSTNTALLDEARAGRAGPHLHVAERQTAGRGRQGRPWAAAPGASLTFSLRWPRVPQAGWGGLSLAVGLAVAQALDPDGRHLGLKWPNDVLLRDPAGPPPGRKLAGILVETVGLGTAHGAVVIGIGVNVQPLPDAGVAAAAAGVAPLPRAAWSEVHPGATAPQALHAIAPVLLEALARFEREGLTPFLAEFARRDVLAGQVVHTTAPDVSQGVAAGVDTDGALRVQTPHGLQRLLAGDVSVRLPAATPTET